MIELTALNAALAELTGDAVKVALVLMQMPRESPEMCVDLSWRARTARELSTHVKIVERSLKELSDAGLCELSRVTLKRLSSAPMSEGSPNLARSSLVMSEAKNEEPGSEASSRAADAASSSESAQGSSLQLPSASAASSKQQGRKGRHGQPQAEPTVASADVQRCIACFDQHYRDANQGAKPTWGSRQYVAMRQLVEKHGAPEVEKRITIMFTAPPRWPAPPYDLQTLASHFDKFATPSGHGGMIDRFKSGETYYGGGS
jgi:hypothetical protein